MIAGASSANEPAGRGPPSPALSARHCLRQVDEPTALVGRNVPQGAQKCRCIAIPEQIAVGRRRVPGRQALVVNTLEEAFHRNIERLRAEKEPRGADPVLAVLVFLDLLKPHAQLLGQLALRHPRQPAPMPDPLSDVNIYVMGQIHSPDLQNFKLKRVIYMTLVRVSPQPVFLDRLAQARLNSL